MIQGPWSTPAPLARDHAADVVVIASHERSGFSRLFAGSVERDVLRDADFAVLVVK